jgi:hypothetical protein
MHAPYFQGPSTLLYGFLACFDVLIAQTNPVQLPKMSIVAGLCSTELNFRIIVFSIAELEPGPLQPSGLHSDYAAIASRS